MAGKSTIHIEDYFIFFDGAPFGFKDASMGGSVFFDAGRMNLLFFHSLTEGYVEDDHAGSQTYITSSGDGGKTWSPPKPFGPVHRIQNPPRESIWLYVTNLGDTLLARGYHQILPATADKAHDDREVRPYTLIIGRKGPGDADFAYQYYAPGAFMEEQFMEAGIILPSGRMVVEMWGVAQRGENWRCGVMLSDDKGKTWRFVTVGYEPDHAIRNDPNVNAGFNEQSLFRLPTGKLVSIIRGRHGLGRLPNSPKDTFYFRSESTDDGETWTHPTPTDIPGTGAALVGLVLPDGSLLHASRIPYARDYYPLPDPALDGLHLARSFDEGQTWETVAFIQHEPDGVIPFDNHYCAMNGQFVPVGENEYLYVFGHFNVGRPLHRFLALRLRVEP